MQQLGSRDDERMDQAGVLVDALALGFREAVMNFHPVVPLAHLPAALGMPAWLLLQWMPDWRWGLEGDRSHLYANMRLFRQPKPYDWASVMKSVRSALGVYLKTDRA
jgi:hypothetical protein